MTEFWKSRTMHWCDVCKCWLNDNKQSIQNHERGMGHRENLARKLRDMGKKADSDKRQEENLKKQMDRIEEEAAKRFAEDKAAAEEAVAATSGRWVWDDGCSYYYNELHRWYYDPKTGWYYGGEPVAWAQLPPEDSLPPHARFGAAPHQGGPVAQGGAKALTAGPGAAGPSACAASGALATTSGAAAASAAAAGMVQKVVRKVVDLPSHPQSMIGGHAMPTAGRVGAAKGLAQKDSPGDKRKRGDAAGAAPGKGPKDAQPVGPAEEAARARREAARQRVAQRTAAGYGFL